MRKISRKIALLMAIVLMASGAIVPQVDGYAKAKLSKTKITIKVGKTYKLKMKGTSKKVKWSSKSKLVATVSSKGVVKGVRVGSTKVYAKVGSKKYTCSVKVKSATITVPNNTPVNNTPVNTTPIITNPSGGNTTIVANSDLAAKVVVSVTKTAYNTATIAITNTNTVAVNSVGINIMYYNASGVMMNTETYRENLIPAGKTVYDYEYFYSEDFPTLDATKSVASVTVDNTYPYTDITAGVTVQSAKSTNNGVSVQFTNTNVVAASVEYWVLLKDASGKIIYTYSSVESVEPGSMKANVVDCPYTYDSNDDHVYANYASFEVGYVAV